MNAMAQDGLINEESLAVPELNKYFGPLLGQVSDSVSRQEGILNKIQVWETF